MDATPSSTGSAPTAYAGRPTGVVSSFSDDRGIGEIAGDDGSAYFFHCTAIADGSRHIDEGTRVTFRVAAGRRGRWEATAIAEG
jgi:cold shock CspA family protein